MSPMKTPGVYIEERNAFPASVVEVATAVPAFIGHTEMAMDGGQSLTGKPWRIDSLAAYHACFGTEPLLQFDITPATGQLGTPGTPTFQAGGHTYQLTPGSGPAARITTCCTGACGTSSPTAAGRATSSRWATAPPM